MLLEVEGTLIQINDRLLLEHQMIDLIFSLAPQQWVLIMVRVCNHLAHIVPQKLSLLQLVPEEQMNYSLDQEMILILCNFYRCLEIAYR